MVKAFLKTKLGKHTTFPVETLFKRLINRPYPLQIKETGIDKIEGHYISSNFNKLQNVIKIRKEKKQKYILSDYTLQQINFRKVFLSTKPINFTRICTPSLVM